MPLSSNPPRSDSDHIRSIDEALYKNYDDYQNRQAWLQLIAASGSSGGGGSALDGVQTVLLLQSISSSVATSANNSANLVYLPTISTYQGQSVPLLQDISSSVARSANNSANLTYLPTISTNLANVSSASNATINNQYTELSYLATLANSPLAASGATYSTMRGDFSAASVSGSKVVTVTGLPFTLEAQHVIAGYAKSISATGVVTAIPNTLTTVTTGSVFFGGATSNFNGSETIMMTVVGPDKGYDPSLDVNKVSEQAPIWNRYTDQESIISAAQGITQVWADLGPEIDCRGYASCGLWITLTINNSTDVRIRALAKHTYAGSEEYSFPTRIVSSTEVKVTQQYLEIDTDANQLLILESTTGNIVPYLQFQVMANATGSTAGQIAAAYVTKGWN